MHVYSHAFLTWATAGATLPDAPVAAVWLDARRLPLTRRGLYDEACQKPTFAGPDPAVHSALRPRASVNG